MRAPILFAAMLLAGCEAAMFLHAPTAAGERCPDGIAGVWQDDADPAKVEFRVSIDSDCNADLRLLENGAWIEARAKLRFHDDFLFVASPEVAAIAGAETERPIPDGFFAWRFVLRDDSLELADPDARRLAHLIIDREVKGRVRKDEGLEVMVEEPADAMAAMLDRHRPFDAQPSVTLHRIEAESEPPPE